MSTSYLCVTCNTVWDSNFPPYQCPNCGSQIIQHADGTSPSTNLYAPPTTQIAFTRPASSATFTITYVLGWVGLILGVALLSMAKPGEDVSPLGLISGLVGIACLLVAFIIGLIKVYRAWDLIQGLRRVDPSEIEMPGPGKAVGFLFIPFYNFYWMFVAYHGLAIRSKKFLARFAPDARGMNAELARAYCILTLCSIIPVVENLFGLANLFVFYFVIIDINRFCATVQASGRGS